jgi:hypothetical protein
MFVNEIKRHEGVQEELKKWEMNFSDRPAEIDGRTLDPEQLCFGQVT